MHNLFAGYDIRERRRGKPSNPMEIQVEIAHSGVIMRTRYSIFHVQQCT